MKDRLTDRFLRLACGLACAVALLLGARTVSGALPEGFMTTSQIRPGMVGEGRTVFHGFKVEPFKVEILGVQHNAMPGTDMILAKLDGQLLAGHGVVAGMSGSPVFIDGKLIGAVAYGWNFSYQPYCGITPIEQMWTVWDNIDRPAVTNRGLIAGGPGGTVPSAAAGEAAGIAGASTVAGWDWEPAWQGFQKRFQGEGTPSPAAQVGFRPNFPAFANLPGEMKPLWSPMFLSGASPRTEHMLKGFFASMGLEMMGAGSLAGSSSGALDGPGVEPAPPLENGSALGVPMLTGDLSLAGVGTVTYCDGKKMIAFGHPMFFQGDTSAPMAQANIMGFMESYNHSFKMGDVREVIGTIDQDRLYAIGGRLGPAPARVPITIQVQGAGAGRPRPYHFSCWKDRKFLPAMAASAAQEAFSASVAENGELTATISYRMTLSDGRIIQKNFIQSADGGLVEEPVSSLLFDLFLVLENPFNQGDVQSIDMAMDVTPGIHQDVLIGTRLEHDTVLAGDTVRLHGRFRPWRGEEYEKVFALDLPRELKAGSYVVHLADAMGCLKMERAQHPERYRPRSYDGVVQLAQCTDAHDNQLQLSLFEPAVDMTLGGFELKHLPVSMGAMMQRSAPPQLQQQSVGRLIASAPQQMDGPVAGSESVAIRVVDHFDE